MGIPSRNCGLLLIFDFLNTDLQYAKRILLARTPIPFDNGYPWVTPIYPVIDVQIKKVRPVDIQAQKIQKQ